MLQYKSELRFLSNETLKTYIYDLKVGHDKLISDRMQLQIDYDKFDILCKRLEEELCWAEHEFIGRKVS